MSKNSFSFQFVTFDDFVSALELIFSPSGASVILFTAAVRCGAQSYSRMKNEVGTKEQALRRLSELKRKENWGKLTFNEVDFANGSGRVVVADALETMARKLEGGLEAGQLGCDFLRGFLTGFLSELLEKSVNVSEEKCARNGDKHCEFLFR